MPLHPPKYSCTYNTSNSDIFDYIGHSNNMTQDRHTRGDNDTGYNTQRVTLT